jgi:hypothetical protein
MRLATEAAVQPRDAGDYFMPSVTRRTDEMPGICASDSSQSQKTEDTTAEGGDQRKFVSSSSD